jgi:hypothetical protein
MLRLTGQSLARPAAAFKQFALDKTQLALASAIGAA